ncbi:MAG TPA: ATP-binding cassette domain-containing protein, partial [Firmicutes bacterium]|nr:ATP-binding cassette domain-containing protein [Bacillota bacterium]
NLHIEEGDYVTIIGSNGSGKSTLLNCITGVYTVDRGTIAINGRNVTGISEHKRAAVLGRVFQDPMVGTTPQMSVEENLSLAARRGVRRGLAMGVGRRERAYYKELLSSLELGLETRLNDPVGTLSGGQRQALSLLMATVKQPKLLLLDEHTAALDPKTAVKVLSLTDKIIRENKLTAMMVTHNMRDALNCGNRLIMMHEGSIVWDIKGELKQKLTVEHLLKRFGEVSGDQFAEDAMLLAY